MQNQLDIKRALSISAFVMVSVISGCVGASPKQPGPQENTIACKAPRPTICTMLYRPVCGSYADGTIKTFSNPCTACRHKNVVSFRNGPCSK